MHATILKKNSILYFLLFLITGFLNSCVDPINVNIDSFSANLVVDGLITDQPGPYEVKLSLSIDYFDRNSNPFANKVSGAEVSILDDKGNIILLNDKLNGTYQTPVDFIGIVGNSYILNIKLPDGREYKSLPEKLLPNVDIDKIYTEYLVKYKLNENNIEVPYDGLNVTIDTNPLNDSKYYRWRYTGTYEVKTFPENQTKKVGDAVLADPPECSGWVPVNGGISKEQVGPCTCCICWIEENNAGALVSQSNFIQGNLRNVSIRFIENQDSRFGIKYHINIEQLSLTKEAHDFWNAIAKQQDQGSLFDQPTGTLPTNLYSVNDPEEKVLGFFSASSIKSKSMFILPSDIPARKRMLPPINADCRALSNASNVKPPFW